MTAAEFASRYAASSSLRTLAPVLLLPLFGGCEEPPTIEDPVPLFERVPIEYPADLWEEGVEGTTLIRVLVGEEGAVDSVLVMETSGHQALDSAAVEGALLLRFEPALQEGTPVQVWAQVPVHFRKDGTSGGVSGSNRTDSTGAVGPTEADR